MFIVEKYQTIIILVIKEGKYIIIKLKMLQLKEMYIEVNIIPKEKTIL